MPEHNIIDLNVGGDPPVAEYVVFDFDVLVVLVCQPTDHDQVLTAILDVVTFGWLCVRYGCAQGRTHQSAQSDKATSCHTGRLYVLMSAFHPYRPQPTRWGH